jgi:hypothetical protein
LTIEDGPLLFLLAQAPRSSLPRQSAFGIRQLAIGNRLLALGLLADAP